jgi:hypothetical protein
MNVVRPGLEFCQVFFCKRSAAVAPVKRASKDAILPYVRLRRKARIGARASPPIEIFIDRSIISVIEHALPPRREVDRSECKGGSRFGQFEM